MLYANFLMAKMQLVLANGISARIFLGKFMVSNIAILVQLVSFNKCFYINSAFIEIQKDLYRMLSLLLPIGSSQNRPLKNLPKTKSHVILDYISYEISPNILWRFQICMMVFFWRFFIFVAIPVLILDVKFNRYQALTIYVPYFRTESERCERISIMNDFV